VKGGAPVFGHQDSRFQTRTKKGKLPLLTKRPLPFYENRFDLVSAGAGRTATGASTLSQIDIGVEMETHPGEINFDIFGFFHKLFINNKFMSFNIKCIVCIFGLIQSHGKRRAASAAGVEKNPDGSGFSSLEIIIDLRFCRIRQFNHW
jgi:hypothetical protein